MWRDISEQAKVGRYFCPMWMLPKEEDFSNQVDRMTHSMDISQPLPATSDIVQQAHKKRGHGVRDGYYVWTQQHKLPFTKINLGTTTFECPVCLCQKLTLCL